MTYPQPNSDQYEIKDYGFFRLNATLSSPGDIYESAQGAKAFAIGPDSDIANAVAVYLDEQVPTTLMQQVAFSANRTMVGSIFSRLDATYGPSARKGRILLYCNDIFDPNYRPTGFDDELDNISFIEPVFDIIQYFEPPQSLGPSRVDRRYYFQDFNIAISKRWIVLPYYGRRYAYLAFKNANGGGGSAINISVHGLSYAIVDDSQGTAIANRFHQETAIISPTLAAGDLATCIITADGSGPADGKGMFDAIVVSVDAEPCVMRMTFSDVLPGG